METLFRVLPTFQLFQKCITYEDTIAKHHQDTQNPSKSQCLNIIDLPEPNICEFILEYSQGPRDSKSYYMLGDNIRNLIKTPIFIFLMFHILANNARNSF